ncbi:MAG: FtsX-like permease family protein [Oscillospiraceae bacterium]|nr:FtsX-like permease family protein [Oscillospiraceae bacterium]
MSRLFRNSLRRVFRTFGRFLAITAIIAISCAFYSGVKASAPEMKASAWRYYSDTALADLHMMSTLGFNDDDVNYILSTVHELDRAYAGYSADLFTDGARGKCVIKLMSFTSDQPLNRIVLSEGRAPIAPDEIVCDEHSGEDVSFKIGDKVRFYAPDDEDVEDILTVTEFTVVGLASSPLYVTDARGHSRIGTGEVTAFAYVRPDAFAYEAYTDIYLSVSDARTAAAFSDYYDSVVSDAADELERSSAVLLDRRRDRIRDDAREELDDARKKLEDAEAEYRKGKREYEQGLAEYDEAKAQIDGMRGEMSEFSGSVEDAMREIDEKTLQMQDLAETCTFIDKFLSDYENTYLQTLPLPLLDSFKEIQASYDANSVDAQVQELLAIYVITDPKTDPDTRKTARDGIIAVNEQVRQATAAALAELDAKREEVKSRSEELSDADTKIQDAQKELNKARAELDKAERELKDGEIKLNDAEEELEKAENELEDRLADGKMYITDRNGFDPDCMSYGDDCDRVDSIAAAFPVFFVLIAALVCCATMTRMVEENRGEAGTLKALGFSSVSIVMQYVLYAAAASTVGSAVGLVLGSKLLPKVIFDCYATMYHFPAFEARYDMGICTGCAVVSLLCTSLSAVYAAVKELRGMPAVLIRPKPPRSGKRIFLEKFPSLWSAMPFLRKVSFRNLFRYKSRFFLMLVGIGGCTALLLTGFGLKYAISAAPDRQYGQIFSYDAMVTLDEDITDEEREEADAAITSLGIYDGHIYADQQKKDVSFAGKKEEAYIFSPADSLEGYIDLRDASTGRSTPLYSGGAVVTEKLASLLGVKTGDSIKIQGAAHDIEIYAVVKNHIGHYVYLSPVTYEELFGQMTPDTILIRTTSVPDRQGRNDATEKLIACGGVTSAVFMQDGLSNFFDLISSLDLIVVVIIIFVGALTFVILLNLAEINITERRYELATIKVLGFFDSEVSSYVYRENTITTVLGVLLGLLVGVAFERFVIVTAEVSTVMFMRDIAPVCFLWTVLLMTAFVILVNVIIFFKLKSIDMASSMKATE